MRSKRGDKEAKGAEGRRYARSDSGESSDHYQGGGQKSSRRIPQSQRICEEEERINVLGEVEGEIARGS